MGVQLSVVVITLAGGQATRRCLDALRGETPDELLLVHRAMDRGSDDDGPDGVIRVTSDTDFVPMRRLAGAHTAGGDWLAFVEDTTVVTHGWCAAARLVCQERGVGVVAGPVRFDEALSSRQLALGIVEYAPYARVSKHPRGVPGNAFLVHRDLLEYPDFAAGIFEDRLGQWLQTRGLEQRMVETLAVTWSGGATGSARLGARFAHGRLFAARRLGHAAPVRRWLLRLASPALLFWLPVRGLMWTAGLRAWRASIHVVAMQCFWALGEIAGYWTGAGDEQETWR